MTAVVARIGIGRRRPHHRVEELVDLRVPAVDAPCIVIGKTEPGGCRTESPLEPSGYLRAVAKAVTVFIMVDVINVAGLPAPVPLSIIAQA